jgi:hypothetical protein
MTEARRCAGFRRSRGACAERCKPRPDPPLELALEAAVADDPCLERQADPPIGRSDASCTARSISCRTSAPPTSGIPRVDVEHVGARLGLGDPRRRGIAAAQTLRERLAPRGLDALADDAEGLLGPDRDGPR